MVFIVIEGIDGAGKTTQAKALCASLSKLGYDVVEEREPTNGAIGKFIRQVLGEKVNLDLLSLQLLFVADRNEHMKALKHAIKSSIVICDRYYYSTIAYGEASGADRKYLESMNSIFPVPDKTFFIDLNPEKAVERIASSRTEREIFEKLDFMEKISKSYSKFTEPNIEHIDGDKDITEISKELLFRTKTFLEEHGIKTKANRIKR
ncbi:putative thymidylate kinase [Candidatus Micrarchaeum sp.]|jgi:dTMP kinase|uniref:dTMP kinase n=1 Tax=Candidatus Micrarchaeum sp. TaxID=2282148 RepID=UPI000A5CCD82|nr:dTMP kinase [Candidatus Micrarchaeum sp.]QRF74193.1 putative thymidylate kinase [Candidatus Micrarchaeum sp.]